MSSLPETVADLTAEGDDLEKLIASLSAAEWSLPTPAPGWTIAHQVAHLSFIFHLAATAASDHEAFQVMMEGAQKDFGGAVNAALAAYLTGGPEEQFARWRAERAAASDALAAAPPGDMVPWLVRPLPPVILACAGIMELFGHGQDIFDAMAVQREYTDRIKHLVGFAILVWDFGYQSRGLTPPDQEFRFELTAPSGELWAFGPDTAADKVTGPAVDFCLLVTRRRHRDDLALIATGAEADRWLDIAQAYRGPAGDGRTPGQFSGS